MPNNQETWSPEGFEGYRDAYPGTPDLHPAPDPAPSARFRELWRRGRQAAEEALSAHAAGTTVVFVRGYLGRYMPGNLAAPCAAAERLGFDAFVAAQEPGGTVAGNVATLAGQVSRRPGRKNLVFCGHSRGGLESLHLLASRPDLAERCRAVILSQTAHGPSYVLESVLLGRHRESLSARRRLSEGLQYAALRTLRAHRGGRELTSETWPGLVRRVEGIRWPFPVLQTASWSTRPTAWLDSFHGRLGEIAPGRAHDGQFFLDDLIWPGLPHVLLPRLDHAQPAMGGHGFDHARYWLTNLLMVLT